MQEIGIVCGYGTALTPAYCYFLDRPVRYIEDNDMPEIICCGGYTQKLTHPGVSEAAVMARYIYSHLSEKKQKTTRIIEEDESLTTLENLHFAHHRHLCLYSKDVYGIVIWCDVARALKIKFIARKFFWSWRHRVETYDISGPDELQKQLIATLLEVAALKFPLLARWHHNQRVKQAERI